MDLYTFLEDLLTSDVPTVMTNEFAQFGIQPREYIGAQILPEQNAPSDENTYRETEIYYRTVIANASTRYSPAQLKEGGVIGGEMLVTLGESDIAQQLTGRRFDALRAKLDEDAAMASQEFLSWVNSLVNMALVEFNEKQRWEAIVDAKTVAKGDSGVIEEVTYPDPTGHRVAAAVDWTDDTKNPWDEIEDMRQQLVDKGYSINRVVTTSKVMTTLKRNVHTARLAGRIQTFPDGSGNLQEIEQPVTDADLARVFEDHDLPQPETYDLNYHDEDGTANRFLPQGTFCIFAETGNQIEVKLSADPTTRRILRDTLGYVGLGYPAGQNSQGRHVNLEVKSNKPPRIEAEGWQTSLPVLTNPEALGVIHSITTV